MNRVTEPAAFILTILWFGTCLALAQAQVQETVEQYRSGETSVTVECFSPGAKGKYPAVFLLHGAGGLDPGTASAFREIGRGLAAQGYVVLIPHYFEKTGHKFGTRFRADEIPSFTEALQDGIEFAVTSGIVDPERIGLVGYSLGAYLAFFQSTRDPRVKAIVSCSGSLPVGWKAKFPPALILQGSKDKGSPTQRLKAFEEKLKTTETPYATHVYRWLGHNFDVSTWDDAGRRMAVFFNQHLKKREPKRSNGKSKPQTKTDSFGDS
jgi:carboxymethylenebutenolidase